MKLNLKSFLRSIHIRLIAYLVASFLWVTSVDCILRSFIKSEILIHRLTMASDFFFIFLTAVFLLFLMKKSEKKLVILKERYRAYFEHSLTGIVVVSQSGQITDCNWISNQILKYGGSSGIKGMYFDEVFKAVDYGEGGVDTVKMLSIKDILIRKGLSTSISIKSGVGKKVCLRLDIAVTNLAGLDEKFIIVNFEDISEKVRMDKSIKEMNHVLELRVEDRTYELKQTIKELELAHNRLVVSERMSALGELVSGITHEINTPVGISITATSYLAVEIERLKTYLNEGKIKKTEMQTIMSSVEEASYIIQRNLEKASDIICSFKQVSTDVHSYQKRTFEIRDLIDDTITSLKPFIRKGDYSFDVKIDNNRSIFAYPGAINQILSNFIVNSINHGFELQAGGKITICCNIEDDRLMIDYSDNGVGIPHENRNKVFTPYFTTKRDDGGTGLGLSIVYKLIVNDMAGEILLYEPSNGGAGFKVTIPLETK